MKVLYCYRYGVLGGVCTQLINRMRVLESDQALEAHLVFAKDLGISETLKDHPHLHFAPDPGAIRRLAAEGRFDAHVVIDTPEYFEALHDSPTPLIAEVHTTVEAGLQYLKTFGWSVAGYIVPSAYSKKLLADRFGIGGKTPVHVVPNSLDVSLFPFVQVSAPGQRPVFAWVGKIDDHKNWRGFLEVAAAVRAAGFDAEFWLIGGETAGLTPKAEMVDRISALELQHCTRWFPRIEYAAMHRAYAAIRASGGAMIATTRNESFGMSVLEALLCGVPVIASEVGALPEIAPGKPYVQFFPFGEYESAAALAVATVAPSRYAAIRKQLDADRPRLLDLYSCERVARRYLETLEQLVRSPGKGAAPRVAEAEVRELERRVAHAEQLQRAIEDLRRHAPAGRPGPDDDAAYLREVNNLLGQRSYRLARRLCQSPRNARFWLTLPTDFVRIALGRAR